MTADAQTPRVPVGLSGVPETLLIPLLGRSMAERSWPALDFKDPWAEELLGRLDYDRSLLSFDRVTLHACAARASMIDDIARAFFAEHPDGIGIALGCGLDQRPERVGTTAPWLELDLPDVVDLKYKLLGDRANVRLVAGSLLEDVWLGEIDRARPALVVVEGVLMYLPPNGVRTFFERVATHLPGSTLAFDYLQSLWVSLGGVHPTVTTLMRARFKWGAQSASHVARFHPKLEVVSDEDVFSRGSKRWRLLGGISRATLLGHSWLGVAQLRTKP